MARVGRCVRHRFDAEHRTHRIADSDRITKGVHDASLPAEARHLVVEPVHADLVAPAEAPALEREQADAGLPALVRDAADVLRLGGGEAIRWWQLHWYN